MRECAGKAALHPALPCTGGALLAQQLPPHHELQLLPPGTVGKHGTQLLHLCRRGQVHDGELPLQQLCNHLSRGQVVWLLRLWLCKLLFRAVGELWAH